MKIVGMKQLRQKFDPIKKGLEKGEEYLLMYRSKPLAVLRPYQANEDSQYLQRPRATSQPTNQPSSITPSTTPVVTSPKKIIADTNLAKKAREIVAPKMTYGDVINGYKTRKANGGGVAKTHTKPNPAIKTQPKIKHIQPIIKNPLGRLGLRRAFV